MSRLRKVVTQAFLGSGVVVTTTRLETMEEAQEREKKAKEKNALDNALGSMTDKEYTIYKELELLIDELEMDGVDVSYFPTPASLTLIKFAKKIGKI